MEDAIRHCPGSGKTLCEGSDFPVSLEPNEKQKQDLETIGLLYADISAVIARLRDLS